MARLFTSLVCLLAVLLGLVSAWDISNENDRHACQAYSRNPLDGCDRSKTLVVDPTNNRTGFKTVQSGKLPQICS